MRRTGAVGLTLAEHLLMSIAAEMGNSTDQEEQADLARRFGRSRLASEQNEFKTVEPSPA